MPCAPRCCARAALATTTAGKHANPSPPPSPPPPVVNADGHLVNLRLSLPTPTTKSAQTPRPACPAQVQELAMQDYDPLHPAAYEPSRPAYRGGAAAATHQPHPDSSLSSVAPRSPLVGYERDYRAPGATSGAAAHGGGGGAWSGAAGDAWGNAGSQQRAHGQGQGQGQGQGGMVPRDARVVDSAGQRRPDEGAPPGGQGSASAQQQQAREGFIRVRILGLERNRRDLYVKFNVEVRLGCPLSRLARTDGGGG